MSSSPALHLDFETASDVDLKRAGLYRYAIDPSTRVLLGAVAGPLGDVVGYDDVPRLLAGLGGTPFMIRAHNAPFERAIMAANGVEVPWSKMDCTQARAQACGLPGSLHMASKVLRTAETKDMEGHKLMLKLAKASYQGTEEELQRHLAYCMQDVRTEVSIDEVLPPLSERERAIWEATQRMNDRGLLIDLPMVEMAIQVADELLEQAHKQIAELTDGVVTKVTQAKKIVAWIQKQGIPCESIGEGHHEELIVCADVVDFPKVAAVVKLRAATAKAFKFKAMLDQVCPDGRIRGNLTYHGAISGRWTGQGVQFHNMKRIDGDDDATDVQMAIHLLSQPQERSPKEIASRFQLLFKDPLETLSLCTRPCIIAPPGSKLGGGDYSNIEGRVCAWISGHKRKVEDFRTYDQKVIDLGKEGAKRWDTYNVTAAHMLGIEPAEVTKQQRQERGKVSELSFQFQGAVGAYKKQGAKYGVRLPDSQIKQFVVDWRETNKPIKDMWPELQEAAIEAVNHRGMVVPALGGRVAYAADKAFLYCRLPSGRYIHYPSPRLAFKTKTVIIDDDPVELNRWTVSVFVPHGKGVRELDLYGGNQTAHIVSGTARDILAEAQLRAEDAGIRCVLTVHDELLTEGEGDLKSIMLQPISWIGDCPISASTWEGPRYDK